MSSPVVGGDWRVLAIDDDEEWGERVKELLEGDPLETAGAVEVVAEDSFDDALNSLNRHRIDLVVLDIRLGDGLGADDGAGLRTLTAIHAVRFVPIVFYSALPGHAAQFSDDPFIDVVSKDSDPDVLRGSVDRLLLSGAPEVQRALVGQMEEVIRSFMVGHVAPQWASTFEDQPGKANLAHILARRLSVALTGSELSRVVESLGFPPLTDTVNPLRYYVVPPVAKTPLVGDLHHVTDPVDEANSDSWWIVLTPTCDLAQHKADFALLARCRLLEQTKAFQDVAGDPEASNSRKGVLREILNNRSPRCYYLPKAFDIPHLIVDFQDLLTIRLDTLKAMTPTASLDSPYSEELQSRFAAYFGRIGTPDLNWDDIVRDIQKQG